MILYYRWTRNINIFLLDKIFIPININNVHWTLVVVYMQLKRIVYRDSLGSDGKKYTSAVKKYIENESLYKQQHIMSQDEINEWTEVATPNDTPQQSNDCDCGVFVCMFVDYLSEDLPINFSQSDMPMLRKKICHSILHVTLPYSI